MANLVEDAPISIKRTVPKFLLRDALAKEKDSISKDKASIPASPKRVLRFSTISLGIADKKTSKKFLVPVPIEVSATSLPVGERTHHSTTTSEIGTGIYFLASYCIESFSS